MFRRKARSSLPGLSPPLRAESVSDVHLLFLNRAPDEWPPDDEGATIVAAASLDHPKLPQPDSRRLLDLLVHHPNRHAGDLVFLSDLSGELAAAGLDWSDIGVDWLAVTDALVALWRRGQVRALRLQQLAEVAMILLATNRATTIEMRTASGAAPTAPVDQALVHQRREELRAMIKADLHRSIATRGPL